jgi:hypothetical protein
MQNPVLKKEFDAIINKRGDIVFIDELRKFFSPLP